MAETLKNKKYNQAIGSRKNARAQVRLTAGDKIGAITINGKDLAVYFPTAELQAVATASLRHEAVPQKFSLSILVAGGGIPGQAEAVRHGIARALIVHDLSLRSPLKKAKLLTRDARMKERRKFGLKKARKAPQWSKR